MISQQARDTSTKELVSPEEATTSIMTDGKKVIGPDVIDIFLHRTPFTMAFGETA